MFKFVNLINFVSVIMIDILSTYQDNPLSYSDSFSHFMIIQISTPIFLNISMINYLLYYQSIIISSLTTLYYSTLSSRIRIINIEPLITIMSSMKNHYLLIISHLSSFSYPMYISSQMTHISNSNNPHLIISHDEFFIIIIEDPSISVIMTDIASIDSIIMNPYYIIHHTFISSISIFISLIDQPHLLVHNSSDTLSKNCSFVNLINYSNCPLNLYIVESRSYVAATIILIDESNDRDYISNSE